MDLKLKKDSQLFLTDDTTDLRYARALVSYNNNIHLGNCSFIHVFHIFVVLFDFVYLFS